MFMLDEGANKLAAILGIVFLLLVGVILNRQITVNQLNAQNKGLQIELEKTKAIVANPAVDKKGDVSVVYRERVVTLTEDQKQAISAAYQVKIDTLNDIIRDLSEKTVEVTKTGDYSSKPVYNNPTVEKRACLVGSYAKDGYFVGAGYKLPLNLDLSAGLGALNGNLAVFGMYRF